MAGKDKATTSSKEQKLSSAEDEEDSNMDLIRQFFAEKLTIGSTNLGEQTKKLIDDLTFDGLIKHWKEKGFKRIITLVGAGISTSAGIPDFRSPGTGLYDNLQKYKLPYAMAIFDIDYFKTNPKPFFTLAKELYPGNFNPTPSHYFVRLLHEKGLLQRHYTQNIDTLERVAGIPGDKLVEAHGTFYTNHCVQCKESYTKEWVREHVFNDKVPKCTICSGVVKPDIVFFGENLPDVFYTKPAYDFLRCDLLIVMGTSLEVYPFASLLEYAGANTARLIINRTRVVELEDEKHNTKDVEYLGDCDDAVWKICDGLGWKNELEELIERENTRLEKKHGATRRRNSSSSSSTGEANEDKAKDKSESTKKQEEQSPDKANKQEVDNAENVSKI